MGRPHKQKQSGVVHKDLKVLRLFCGDIEEWVEIVIGKDGFHFFKFPDASLKEFLKEAVKKPMIWESLSEYESSSMEAIK